MTWCGWRFCRSPQWRHFQPSRVNTALRSAGSSSAIENVLTVLVHNPELRELGFGFLQPALHKLTCVLVYLCRPIIEDANRVEVFPALHREDAAEVFKAPVVNRRARDISFLHPLLVL